MIVSFLIKLQSYKYPVLKRGSNKDVFVWTLWNSSLFSDYRRLPFRTVQKRRAASFVTITDEGQFLKNAKTFSFWFCLVIVVGRRETTACILPIFKHNWWRNGLVSNISNVCNVVCIDVWLAQNNLLDCIDFCLALSNGMECVDDCLLLRVTWWTMKISTCSFV